MASTNAHGKPRTLQQQCKEESRHVLQILKIFNTRPNINTMRAPCTTFRHTQTTRQCFKTSGRRRLLPPRGNGLEDLTFDWNQVYFEVENVTT